MKTFRYVVIAAVAVPVLAGPSFAQTSKPAAPPVAAAEDVAKAAVKTVAGELVSIDQKEQTVTVRHMVGTKPARITVHVEESAAASLTPFKPGDHVKVTYVETGAKRIMKNIVKG